MATPMVFPPPRNPNGPGRGPIIVGITWLFTGLATIAAMLRMYVGKKWKTGLAIDDWIMFLVNQALITKSYLHGLGKHDADLQLLDQLAEAIGDGRSIKARYMTDEQIAEPQAAGSWLFFYSEPCVRSMSNYIDMKELIKIVPRLTAYREYLRREKPAIYETCLS
ncbi:hypothetical protein DL766_006136 [Monosporascus sp. MC13-8B]|uniref:Uncharacterized protein n=1 Tax=Monosporascus cannonballus TaxID=155416 RepID=A0ABY0HGK2_9PEZI|nr:hypothetical protein DL762_002822 [Monosporascus cannonballus]RYO97573.1 hypothetical protein DL763_002686 [Monosporascus cannonballus]RYP27947.1 hypothetical protein DL766_006136 [Monosporascus sp. MC13-8B]